jgi:hypothetical protein
MPDAAWAVSVHPPSVSRRSGQPPVLGSSTQKLDPKSAAESMGAVSSIRVYNSTWQLIRFRHFCSGSLALASLNLACRNLVPTFPQRSPLLLLTTAACGGLRSTPDCRPRRTFLHLSYSCASPFGPAILVTQDPKRPFRFIDS